LMRPFNMRVLFLTVLAAVPLHGADVQKLALDIAAQADFERVLALSAPDLASTAKCVQSQAMSLAVASAVEAPQLTFRKAYCQMADAVASQNRTALAQAAQGFDDAIAAAEAVPVKEKRTQNVPYLLNAPHTWRILAAVARLNAGATSESQEQLLSRAVDSDSEYGEGCQTNAVSARFCRSVHQLGSAWLGWMAREQGDPLAAARRFANANAPGWKEWIAGLEAFRQGNYSIAAADYGKAIGIWHESHPDSLTQRMNPVPDMSEALTDWGGAQLVANDPRAALANLDAAIKTDAANSRALYLRGLAKQHLGRKDDAMDDLNLASRAAFAKKGDAGAAEAHVFRGITLYWRKEFLRAENEFASALNGDIAAPWQSDARAWRLLAAVASGACGASRSALERAMASVSPYFPRTDANAALATCPATASGSFLQDRRFVLQFP
jgi:tetratricopeptide (TPR) repeat protein